MCPNLLSQIINTIVVSCPLEIQYANTTKYVPCLWWLIFRGPSRLVRVALIWGPPFWRGLYNCLWLIRNTRRKACSHALERCLLVLGFEVLEDGIKQKLALWVEDAGTSWVHHVAYFVRDSKDCAGPCWSCIEAEECGSLRRGWVNAQKHACTLLGQTGIQRTPCATCQNVKSSESTPESYVKYFWQLLEGATLRALVKVHGPESCSYTARGHALCLQR